MGMTNLGGDKRSRNVDLNLVPMIDLMSCMTAFLLVTAVWSTHSQLDTEPKGKGRQSEITPPEHDVYSVLVRTDAIVLGDRRSGEVQRFARTDFAGLQVALAELYAQSAEPGRAEAEIAGESLAGSPVVYQDLVDAMSAARAAGIRHLGVVDPAGLTGLK
jgi:biopolymer transport protein ExbD